MNQNKFPTIKTLGFTALLAAGFYLWQINASSYEKKQQELAVKIRAEVLKEVQTSLKDELRAEVKKELLVDLNKDIQRMVKQEVSSQAGNLVSNSAGSGESISSALINSPDFHNSIQRIVEETVASIQQREPVGDAELAQHVASGAIEPNTGFSLGVNKSLYYPDMILAKAETSSGKKTAGSTAAKAPAKKTTTTKQTTASPAITSHETKEEQRAESLERTLQQRGSILLPKGKLQLEPGVSWAHFSSNRINIQGFSILPVLVIGDISTEEVKRDVFIETLSAKYGLLNNLQTEIKIPYRGEYDRINVSSTSETTRQTSGLGDIEVGVSRQIGWEHGVMPDLIASFGLKSRTGREPYNNAIALGTGHYGFRSSLIAVKSSDPAVVFGSLSYIYNMERKDIPNFGNIKPGDSIGYSLGTAIALSYKTAISFSFDNSVTFQMKRNGRYLADSFLNVANFKTGLNWAINERSSVDFSVSMGLTKDSPDVSVEIKFPITF